MSGDGSSFAGEVAVDSLLYRRSRFAGGRCLPAGWKGYFDERSQGFYYVHEQLQETTWVMPTVEGSILQQPGLVEWIRCGMPNGVTYRGSSVLPEGWELKLHEDETVGVDSSRLFGAPYYLHAESGERTWLRPCSSSDGRVGANRKPSAKAGPKRLRGTIIHDIGSCFCASGGCSSRR